MPCPWSIREFQFALAEGTMVARQKVIDNLPGRPLLSDGAPDREAQRIRQARSQRRARDIAGSTHSDVIARAAAFLLLSDSKASFTIEGGRRRRSVSRDGGRPSARRGRSR